MSSIMDVTGQKEGLKVLLVKRLRLRGVDPSSIGDEDPLLKGPLGLDSIDVLELVLAVEEEYGLKISDEQLSEGTFNSIAALAEFVRTNGSSSKVDGGGRARPEPSP
jgi:acyl carrier protein